MTLQFGNVSKNRISEVIIEACYYVLVIVVMTWCLW